MADSLFEVGIVVDLGPLTVYERNRVTDTLARTIKDQVDQMREYIVSTKMPEVGLHQRSGALAESVKPMDVEVSDWTIQTGMSAGGGDVDYAQVFEEGGSGTYPIPKDGALPYGSAMAFYPTNAEGESLSARFLLYTQKGKHRRSAFKGSGTSIRSLRGQFGQVVVRRVKAHPPAKATHFLSEGVNDRLPQLLEAISKVLQNGE